jgi:hypothetical protein
MERAVLQGLQRPMDVHFTPESATSNSTQNSANVRFVMTTLTLPLQLRGKQEGMSTAPPGLGA